MFPASLQAHVGLSVRGQFRAAFVFCSPNCDEPGNFPLALRQRLPFCLPWHIHIWSRNQAYVPVIRRWCRCSSTHERRQHRFCLGTTPRLATTQEKTPKKCATTLAPPNARPSPRPLANPGHKRPERRQVPKLYLTPVPTCPLLARGLCVVRRLQMLLTLFLTLHMRRAFTQARNFTFFQLPLAYYRAAHHRPAGPYRSRGILHACSSLSRSPATPPPSPLLLACSRHGWRQAYSSDREEHHCQSPSVTQQWFAAERSKRPGMHAHSSSSGNRQAAKPI